MIKASRVAALLLALPAASSLIAQDAPRSAPMAVPISPPVPEPQDIPYAGTMVLDIDATDIERGAYRVTQTIPVAPGTSRLTLLYPQWLPGDHGPRGMLDQLVDLHFFAGTQELRWQRDPVEVFAFHVAVPAGARQVTAKFIHTSPLQSSEGRITMTPEMLNLQWERMSLYPAGHYVRRIMVKPVVSFPAGWQVATALDGQSAPSGRVTWNTVDYETLIDSPIFAGLYFRKWDLGNRVTLNVVADRPEQLEARPENVAAMRAMVDESLIAFGSHHWDHYEFLVALTDRMGGIGREHQRSSENQMQPENFIRWAEYDWDRNVLPHELSHSWVGKFRRPARLWTPDYRQPMQDDLLWVYEGQNQFWGIVLAARSGVQSKQIALDMLASNAGAYSVQPGRSWRSVEDTGYDPVIAARRAKPYASFSRGEDYYNEGALIWLEADQIIRAGTGGTRGLDNFAAAFFGIRNGDWGQVTYEFDDVVSALNGIYPYDWAGFFKTRIQMTGRPAPLAGIEKAGYRLVWKGEPNTYDRARAAGSLSLTFSLGVTIDKDGRVTSARWGSPAFDAGIVTGAKIVAVSGIAYDQEGLKRAITAAKGTNVPVDLLVQRGERFMNIAIPYHDGLRWPWLERAAPGNEPTGLDRLLAPRRVGAVR